jgi:HK97 family phage major capsid protein
MNLERGDVPMSKVDELLGEIQSVWDTADAEGREATRGERAKVERLLKAVEREHVNERIKAVVGGGPDRSGPGMGGADFHGMSPGEAFVQSEGYKAIQDPSARGRSWTTGEIDTGAWGFGLKGTLLEGAGNPGSGTGGGWVPAPQVVNGVVQRLFQPLRFEELLMSGQATTSTVRYAVEGTATSAAAGVAEAGLKPESTLAYSTVDEQVKKIATTVQISDELLEDAPAITTFINSRLTLFVQIETERQLFRGTAGGNEVQGLLTSRGVPVYAGGTAVGNKAVQMFKAMNGLRGSAFLEPEWVAMHPTDYQDIRLLADTAGQFFGGGPFMGAYGNPTSVDANGQITGATDLLWGKPVYVTSAIGGAGTAIVGTREGAQVWSRGGLRVESTNSHASNFTSDITAIRAERRLALSVYRANAYVEVRLA